MRMAAVRFTIVLGMIAFLAGSVVAQDQEAETAQPFRFSVDIKGELTDNRDSSELNEEENFDIHVTPRFDVYADTDRMHMDLYYAPSYRYRNDPNISQNENEFYHDLGLKVYADVAARTKLRIHEHFNYTDDSSVDEGGRTIREDRSYIMNRVQGALRYQVNPERTHVELFAKSSIKRYDDEVASASSDEDQTDFGLQLWHQVAERMGVYARGSMSAYGYENAFDIDRDFDMITAVVGVEQQFAPHLKGGIEGGLQDVEYSDDSLGSDDSPYGRAWIRRRTDDVVLEASASHGFRDSDVFPFASQEYTEVYGRGQWEVDAQMTFGLSAAYRTSTYDVDSMPEAAKNFVVPGWAEGLVTANRTEGDEDRLLVKADVAYRLGDNTSIKLVQSYEDVDSDVTSSFTKNTTSLILHQDF